MVRGRIGRNQPCPCGSGKKYKKCHLLEVPSGIPVEVLAAGIAEIDRIEREHQRLEDMGIFVNHVRPVIHQGRKVWAIGSRVYFSDSPKQTFQEFIIGILVQEFGLDWWRAQEALPRDEQHFVVRSYVDLREWRRRQVDTAAEVKPGVWMVPADGATQYILALAYDLTTLLHAGSVPDGLMARLRHRDQFQGARHELAAAAIFARVGCEVSFLREPSTKHPEFVARFLPTGQRIAVEAKSRHRGGVIHEPGNVDSEAVMKGDVSRLLRSALVQNPGDIPFMIFIDVNTPPIAEPGFSWDRGWFRDVRELLDDYPAPTPDQPEEFAAIFFTSYSYQYQAGVPATSSGHACVWPAFTRHPVDPELQRRLNVAVANYGKVPDIDVLEDSM